MYAIKKIRLIIREIFFSQIVAIKHSQIYESVSKLFSFLHSDFRKDPLIEEIQDALYSIKLDHSTFLEDNENELPLKTDHIPEINFEEDIDLLSISVMFDQQFDWDISSNENEDILLLHRLSWMMPLIAEEKMDSKRCFLIINHWIKSNPNLKNNHGWDAYSISERVCNIIMLIRHFSNHNNEETQINYSLVEQLLYLSENLEFRGSATNNHLLNNARALYIGGAFLSLQHQTLLSAYGDYFKKMGALIIEKFYYRVFSKSGMNKEGSTHYQLVFTKWNLEILWMAHYIADVQMIDFIELKSKRASQASSFLMSFDEFPFIGDISPDAHLNYFSEMPLVAPSILAGRVSEKNIGSFSGIGCFLETEIVEEEKLDFKNDQFQDDGYFVIQNDELCMLFYVNPNSYVAGNTHAHSDTGSFILWHKKMIIFDDSGRHSYNTNHTADSLRSIASHNGLKVNGVEPVFIHGLNSYPELHTVSYLKNDNSVVSINENQIILSINGYRNRGNSSEVVRTFSIEGNELHISDLIRGKGLGYIETFFQTRVGLKTKISSDENHIEKIILSMDKQKLLLIEFPNSSFRKQEIALIDSPTSKRYGNFKNKKTVVFRQKSILPVENQYKIRFL